MADLSAAPPAVLGPGLFEVYTAYRAVPDPPWGSSGSARAVSVLRQLDEFHLALDGVVGARLHIDGPSRATLVVPLRDEVPGQWLGAHRCPDGPLVAVPSCLGGQVGPDAGRRQDPPGGGPLWKLSGPSTSFAKHVPSAVGNRVPKKFAREAFLPNGAPPAMSTYGAPFAVLHLWLSAISRCAVGSSPSSRCMPPAVA